MHKKPAFERASERARALSSKADEGAILVDE
jgi:hypothetical protein